MWGQVCNVKVCVQIHNGDKCKEILPSDLDTDSDDEHRSLVYFSSGLSSQGSDNEDRI